MCLSPILIDNPNFGQDKVGLNFLKDTENSKLAIPCGVCAECIAVKQMYLVQRVQMESLKNHIFFATLTYSNEYLPKCVTSTGFELSFADIRDFQLMVKRLYNDNAFGVPFRYFAVSELGSTRGRPHFHILWLIPKKPSDTYNDCLNYEYLIKKKVLEYWSRNYGSRRVPDYKPLCEYHECFRGGKLHKNYDLHYVNPALTEGGCTTVAFYVLKYMLKPSNRAIRLQQALHLNLDEYEYRDIWNIIRPRYFKSLGFGYNGIVTSGRTILPDVDIVSYLRKCVKQTPPEYGYPFYYNPDSGDHFPLARYYKDNPDIFSLKDAYNFYYLKDDNNVILRSGQEAVQKIDKFVDTCNIADLHGYDDIFTNL